MKPDQERVSTLLLDTVTLLCRNGLTFKHNLKVQGLIGITIDDEEVFIVHIDEKVNEENDNDTEDILPQNLNTKALQLSVSKSVTSATLDQKSQNTSLVAKSSKRSVLSQSRCTDSVQYNEPASVELNQKQGDVIDIESEGEEIVQDSFKEEDSESGTNNFPFQNAVLINKPKYSSQDFDNTDVAQDDVTYETLQPKLEPGYDLNAGCEYSSFPIAEEQFMDTYGNDRDQTAYQSSGEIYADAEENLEDDDDVKPNLGTSSASFSSWQPEYHSQFPSFYHQGSNRRQEMAANQKMTKRLETTIQAHRRVEIEHLYHDSCDAVKLHPWRMTAKQRLPVQSSSSQSFACHAKVMFICDLCNQPFTDRSNLRRHQIVKHGRQKMKRGRPPKNVTTLKLGIVS